jgi:hypothetical protein
MLTTQTFYGLDCVELANQAVSLLVTRSVGPRIIALARRDGANLLAHLPHHTIANPTTDHFRSQGGHRLWVAPEVPARTYLPDNQPVRIAGLERGLEVVQPIEPTTGLQKTLRISLPEATLPLVVVDHGLTNCGAAPIECAAWAITQLPPGGIALLPQTRSLVDAAGVQPNRTLALWPYTDIAAPQIHWGNQVIRVAATLAEGALKLGWSNRVGWQAYVREDSVFVKHARYQPEATYYDGGSSSQYYCGVSFLELETLSPRCTLAPGATIQHREVWSLHQGRLADLSEAAALDLIGRLDLAHPASYLASAPDQP